MHDMDVSAVICTYNGADRLPEVLECLEAQQVPDGVAWEVLVVDNNSSDGTRSVVEQAQSSWNPDGVPLRYEFEGRQGKSNAVQTGVRTAGGEIVALLDDDNLPRPDWIAEVHAFGQSHPDAGVFGGQIHPLVEIDLPASFGLVKPLLFPNENPETFSYSEGGRLRLGASGSGLVVKKRAWIEAIGDQPLDFKGPTGSGRGTLGEEYEIQWRIYKAGWEIWHNAEMHLDHKIPPDRFEREYLKDFFKAIGLSRYTTRMMRYRTWQRPFMTVAYWGADIWKILRLTLKYRSKTTTDKFVNGRLRMIFFSMIAPFQN